MIIDSDGREIKLLTLGIEKVQFVLLIEVIIRELFVI